MKKKYYIPREKTREFSCPICFSHEIKRFKFGKTALIECLNCGIIYNRDIPSQQDLNSYYRKEYKTTSSASASDIEQRRIFRIPEQIKIISLIRQYVLPPARLLDIGCDRGFFLDEARRWGYDVRGTELSEVAKKYCRQIGLKINSTLRELGDKFDIVTLWHSLEHQRNPRKTLDEIKSYLSDGGFIFLRVPSFDSFWCRLLKHRWIWFQPENHYFHFTEKSLVAILKIAGYEPLKIIKRKPNDKFTKKLFKMLHSILKNENSQEDGVKQRLGRFVQNLTGVELFAVGRKLSVIRGK